MKRLFISLIILIAAGALGVRILRIPPGQVSGLAHHDHDEHEGHDHDHGEDAHVELSAEAVKSSGIVVETAGPAALPLTLKLYGKITASEDETAHMMARFPGVIQKVAKRLGDTVKPGDTLAVIESNESLRPYEIKAMMAGTIIRKEAAPGEFVSDKESLFVISNLDTIWVDLSVHRSDFARLHKGQRVVVDTGLPKDDGESLLVDATIDYLSPFGTENTQTMLARAIIRNPEGLLRPGLFVTGNVVTDTREVEVAVKAEAIQRIDDKAHVFVQQGDRFDLRPVTVGVETPERVEIRAGLHAGESVATKNSFILKAELGKSEASHEH